MNSLKKNKCNNVAHKKMRVLLSVLILLLSVAATVSAGQDAGPFQEGSGRLTILIGSGTASENNIEHNYTILGVGAGYYVIDGLEVGLDVEDWVGSGPRIYRVSPEIHYVFYKIETLKPYAGVFYRRNIVEGHDDSNTIGVRAGGMFLTGKRSYIGVGVVYDKYLNCDHNLFSSCSETYPEVMIAVTF